MDLLTFNSLVRGRTGQCPYRFWILSITGLTQWIVKAWFCRRSKAHCVCPYSVLPCVSPELSNPRSLGINRWQYDWAAYRFLHSPQVNFAIAPFLDTSFTIWATSLSTLQFKSGFSSLLDYSFL